MSCAFFFNFTQLLLVVTYQLSGQIIGYYLQGSRSPSPLKVGPMGCPETSVRN